MAYIDFLGDGDGTFQGGAFKGGQLVDVTPRDWAFYSVGLRAGSSSEGS